MKGKGRQVKGNKGGSNSKKRRTSWDTVRLDVEDLLELDEEEEFRRPDADQIVDEEDDGEDPDAIEDLGETLEGDEFDRPDKDEDKEGDYYDEPDEEQPQDDPLTDDEIRDIARDYGKAPEGIQDLDGGRITEQEYDAYDGEVAASHRVRRLSADDIALASPPEGRGNGKRSTKRRRKKGFRLPELSPFEWAAIAMSLVIVVTAVSLGSVFLRIQKQQTQTDSFKEIGADMDGIRIIGESGLLAMRDAAALHLAEESMEIVHEEAVEEPAAAGEGEAKKEEEVTVVNAVMHLTSIKSDIKIKFVNQDTGKLVGGTPFTVTAKEPGGKENTWDDHDQDGIIYKSGVSAGTWTITPLPLSGEAAERVALVAKAQTVSVKEQIEFKKVDVADEIKKESQVDVSAEDTEPQEAAAVESVNVDTVEWVESSVEEVEVSDEGYTYREVKKSDIVEPELTSKAGGGIVDKIASLFLQNRLTAKAAESTDKSEKSEEGESGQNGESNKDSENNKDSESGHNSENSQNGESSDTGSTSDEKKLDEDEKQVEDASAPVRTISLSPDIIDMEVGVIAIITPASTGYLEPVYKWKSSDEKVATVTSDGVVTGTGPGSCTITLWVDGDESLIATSQVSVTGEATLAPAKKVTLKPTTLSMTVGSKSTISVTVEGMEDKSVSWKTSDNDVATVDSQGEVKAISAGKALITVTSWEDDTIKATCEVEVHEAGQLRTKSGETVYVKDGDGYREATTSDYSSKETFYLKVPKTNKVYHGWQEIDGYTYYYDKDGKVVTGDQVIQGMQYHFSDTGILSTGSGVLGVDVSKWNGTIDWNAVKNSGVHYAIIRCGFRGTATGVLVEDSMFHTNMKGALAAGLKVGVYFYSSAVNDVEGVEEASMAASLCSGYKLAYPVFLDVERSDSGSGRADKISTADRTAAIKAFCATMASSGYKTGLYANKNWMEEMIDTPSLTGYKLWLAQYSKEPSYSRTRFDIWQYTSKGTVAGIKGKVDLNISYLNY